MVPGGVYDITHKAGNCLQCFSCFSCIACYNRSVWFMSPHHWYLLYLHSDKPHDFPGNSKVSLMDTDNINSHIVITCDKRHVSQTNRHYKLSTRKYICIRFHKCRNISSGLTWLIWINRKYILNFSTVKQDTCSCYICNDSIAGRKVVCDQWHQKHITHFFVKPLVAVLP